MKKLIIISTVVLFSLYSCGSGRSNNNKAEETDRVIQSDNSSVAEVAMSSEEQSGSGSIKLTKTVFLEKVWDYNNTPAEWKYKGDKPALIDFYADWCGPCKIAAPILEEISDEYFGKIYVYKIDTEVERELSAVFGIQGIPAFLYIPATGKPVMMSGIARTKEETKEMFKNNIEKYLLSTN